MPSRINGYDYDIFISYRHNDDKYDNWVTEFAANLNTWTDTIHCLPMSAPEDQTAKLFELYLSFVN